MFTEVKKLNKKTVYKLALAFLLASGLVVVALICTVARPKRAEVCVGCHTEVAFTNACKKAAPGDVSCPECHTHSGIRTSVMAVEIQDNHCTAAPCHPVDALVMKDIRYKKMVSFQHKTHLAVYGDPALLAGTSLVSAGGNELQEEGAEPCGCPPKILPENLKMGCASCHNSRVGEKHFGLDDQTCNICHFTAWKSRIQADQDFHPSLEIDDTVRGKSVSDCSLCHIHVEKTKEIYGKTFRHGAYEGNGKALCTDCHFTVIHGNGEVEKERCYRCHTEVSGNFQSAPDMHYHHTVKHKTDCAVCHALIVHSWEQTDAASCEGDDIPAANMKHETQRRILMGQGGRGVQGEPDPMHLATLNCVACHKDTSFEKVEPRVCDNCHERGFRRILAEQKRFVSSQMRLLKTFLARAKRLPGVGADPAVLEAAANYAIITEDGSLGAHNIKYVKDLLGYSINRLKLTVLGDKF